jgi:hypothetical protein
MVASLEGIIFDQIYGDNTGGAEFDFDGDGTATQEDEFVSFTNTSGTAVDVSGWQIWSDATGAGAPDGPQDGLYHTFPPGTVFSPGETIYIVNEITGTPAVNMQEASEGGVESGAGGTNTNFLSEGGPTGQSESLALVNPDTGEYIILNMADGVASIIPGLPGFPGTTSVGESNAAADSGVEDQNAGSSYQYNSVTDSYDYAAVAITCFAQGTLISVPGGRKRIEDLRIGDLVETKDHGPQPICAVLHRKLNFESGDNPQHQPIEIKPGALGNGRPERRLIVSPQHRILIAQDKGDEVLCPAKGLLERRGFRVMKGCRAVAYFHLVFRRHEVIESENAWTESFYPGEFAIRSAGIRTKNELFSIFPTLKSGKSPSFARRSIAVSQGRQMTPFIPVQAQTTNSLSVAGL